MSESTIVLPIEVSDQKALAELKKIQASLGAVGKESADLNKRIADSMGKMATGYNKAFADITEKTKGFKQSWTELNQALEVGNKVLGGIRKAVEAAQFSAEFQRLEKAVPVEKFRELQRETQGTVSKFDLLKKAAADMNLAATAGLDEHTAAMKRSFVVWEDFYDRVKAGFGELIGGLSIGLARMLGIMEEGKEEARRRRGEMAAIAKYGAEASGHVPRNTSGDYMLTAEQKRAAELQRAVASTRYQAEMQRAMFWEYGEGRYGDDEGAFSRSLESEFGAGNGSTGAWVNDYSGLGTGRRGRRLLDATRQQRRPDTNTLFGVDRPGDRFQAYFDLFGRGAGDALSSGAGALGLMNPPGVGDVIGREFGGEGGGNWLSKGALGGASNGIDAQMKKQQEFMKQIQDQTTVLGGAYTAMSAGLTAAVDAAISGSDAIGKAALKASAAALKAIAVEATAKSLFSLAEGLFTGNGAAFAASAKYAAAAVVAGAGSAVLGGAAGGGATTGPSSAAASGGSATGSRQEAAGPVNVTVNIQGATAGDQQKLGREVNRATRAALKASRIRNDQTLTVRFE